MVSNGPQSKRNFAFNRKLHSKNKGLSDELYRESRMYVLIKTEQSQMTNNKLKDLAITVFYNGKKFP